MSHKTITQAARDPHLTDRVVAAAQKEAWESDTLKDTAFAAVLRDDPSEGVTFMWPVSIEYETEYSYAVDEGNPDPGGDDGVITDGNISASVVKNWPVDTP